MEQQKAASQDARWPGARDSKRYLIYLIAVALFGWALISAARYPGQLRRRLASLQDPTADPLSLPPPKYRV